MIERIRALNRKIFYWTQILERSKSEKQKEAARKQIEKLKKIIEDIREGPKNNGGVW